MQVLEDRENNIKMDIIEIVTVQVFGGDCNKSKFDSGGN
jgi:hypothetical protein